MVFLYIIIAVLTLLNFGLLFCVCFQQVLFLRGREALEQKLLARDLNEYVERRLDQEPQGKFSPSYRPEELTEEDDVYMDIDQVPASEAHEAIMNHINGK